MYQQIADFDNLISSARQCLNGKRASPPALRYFRDLEVNLHRTFRQLISGEYEPGHYEEFYVTEPKRRLISAPSFADRVVHRAIINAIEPEIDKRFIFDSYACRKGKGAHAGTDRVQKWMRIIKRNHGQVFCLKADISKYFASINHAKLKRILRTHISCQQTLSLLDRVIDSSPGSPGVGIPLGNLTSQLFANLYLNELDRYAKHVIGIRYYARYMDDFVALSHNKAQLAEWRKRIEAFLSENLHLTTNSKTQIFPISKSNGRALDFLGYRIYPTHRLLRKNSIKRMRHKLKKMRQRIALGLADPSAYWPVIQSWDAHASHANTWRLRQKMFSEPLKGPGNESLSI